MNNQKTFKRIASFMLVMALLVGLMPVGNLGYADQLKPELIKVEEDQAGLKVLGYEGEELLSLDKVDFKDGESALDFSKRLMDEKKLAYKADQGYISEIAGLGAMDKGQYSGWMTKVNGEMPQVGLGDIKLKKDDLVEIFYVQNYNSLYQVGKGQLLVEGFKGEKILTTDFLAYEKDESALGFTKRILDQNKIAYKADQGYISEVGGLKALDKGPRSGWMVKVNDLMPQVGLGDLKFEDGMVVKLFYVEDYQTLFPPEEGGDVDQLFTDMAKHEWAREAVESLAIDGVIEGTGDNKFSPGQEVTRAEFATMVSRLLELEELGDNRFKDLKKTDWFYEDVVKLSNKGYIKGREDGNFDPKGKITRQEIATIIGNILADKDFVIKDKDLLKKFKDHKDIAAWAYDGSALVVQEEIVNGIDGSFMPRKNASRAEAATMLYRLSEKIK